MKVLLRISNKRTDLADMFKLLLNSGSCNNSSGRNMVLSPSHFIVITLSSLSAFDLSTHHDFSFLLAYVVVPGIQSTPSSPLNGSTSAVVPSVCECPCGPDLTVSTQNASSLYGRSSSITAQSVSSTYKTQSNANSSDNISSSVTSSICSCPCGLSTSAMDPTCK